MIKSGKVIYGVVSAVAALLLSASSARAGDTRSDLQDWLQADSRNWLSVYVWDSISNITVVESSDSAIVFSARYSFRLGDTTQADTAYFAFSNGHLYCLAYAWNREYCTLLGKQRR
jgi:hypothetical protein